MGASSSGRISSASKAAISFSMNCGPVTGTVQEILGGVRSACTYVGARRLRELSKRTTFVRVSQQSNEVFGRT